MAYMNGTGEMGKIKLFKNIASKVTKVVNKVQSNVKNVVQKAQTGIKKGLNVVGKVGLLPARMAFLGAVNLNVLKLATRISQAYAKNPDEVKKFWAKFKGDWSALRDAVNKGAKTSISGTSIGVVGAATISAASPIIIAILELFKKLKSDKPGDVVKDDATITELKNALVTDENTPLAEVTTSETGTGTGKGINKTLLIVGGAVVVGGAYMLMKKRK